MSSVVNIAKIEEKSDAEKSQKRALIWVGISIVVGLLIWLLPTPVDLGTRGHAFLALLAVIVPMANLAGTPVVPIAMSVPLATTFVLLVIGCPPTLIAYGFGYFTQWEAFKILLFRTFLGIVMLSLIMALWYPFVGMPGNIDNMKTPAKLTPTGYELVVKP